MKNDFNWENLKYFNILAQTLNLTEASRILGTTPATVSRRVKSLETDLQAKLFEVTPHGHSLTSTGDNLFQKCLPIEEQMQGVSRQIFGQDLSVSGAIKITTTDTISHTVLPSILEIYQKEFPAIQLELFAKSNFFNLSKREADIAIRPSSNPPENLIGRRLGRIQFNVYASKGYLKKNSIKNLSQNLNSHSFIQLDDSLSHLPSRVWLSNLLGSKKSNITTDGLLTSAAMCSRGLGIAVLPSYFSKYYKDLSVIKKLDEKVGSDFWLLTHKDIRNTLKIRETMDFLEREIKKSLSDFI